MNHIYRYAIAAVAVLALSCCGKNQSSSSAGNGDDGKTILPQAIDQMPARLTHVQCRSASPSDISPRIYLDIYDDGSIDRASYSYIVGDEGHGGSGISVYTFTGWGEEYRGLSSDNRQGFEIYSVKKVDDKHFTAKIQIVEGLRLELGFGGAVWGEIYSSVADYVACEINPGDMPPPQPKCTVPDDPTLQNIRCP